MTPLWARCTGGCHLDRRIDRLILSAGFEIASIQVGYMNALKPLTYMYEGRARQADGAAPRAAHA